MFLTRTTSTSISALSTILRTNSPDADERWRTWAHNLLGQSELNPPILITIWQLVLDFDAVLAGYVRRPVATDGAVLVAGSGKESLKTFNVSTAASILAAAAGAQVVKGVSRSVSAVSGSVDVLHALGIPPCDEAADLPEALARNGVVFVPYAAFCPTYARRYDGVFTDLTPFSFFMPIAVLAVQARAFVYGIAHPDVVAAAAAIRAARPDLRRGTVVATVFGDGSVMDEDGPFGTGYRADVCGSRIHFTTRRRPEPTPNWSLAVRHRSTHRENAELVMAALSPEPRPPHNSGATLVERNAALILQAHSDNTLDETAALRAVRSARNDGHALKLVAALQSNRSAATSAA